MRDELLFRLLMLRRWVWAVRYMAFAISLISISAVSLVSISVISLIIWVTKSMVKEKGGVRDDGEKSRAEGLGADGCVEQSLIHGDAQSRRAFQCNAAATRLRAGIKRFQSPLCLYPSCI